MDERPETPATRARDRRVEALRTQALLARDPAALASLAAGEDAPGERQPWDCPFCGHELQGGGERCDGCGALAVPPDAVALDALRGNARMVYLLQALTPLCGVSAVAGLLLAYANRGAARDTWLDSHYEWQIDSFWGIFWFSLAAVAAGWVARVLVSPQLGQWVMMGGALVATAWLIHRVVKGWTRLADGDPVTDW